MNHSTVIPSYAEGLKELRKNLESMLPEEALETFNSDALALEKQHGT